MKTSKESSQDLPSILEILRKKFRLIFALVSIVIIFFVFSIDLVLFSRTWIKHADQLKYNFSAQISPDLSLYDFTLLNLKLNNFVDSTDFSGGLVTDKFDSKIASSNIDREKILPSRDCILSGDFSCQIWSILRGKILFFTEVSNQDEDKIGNIYLEMRVSSLIADLFLRSVSAIILFALLLSILYVVTSHSILQVLKPIRTLTDKISQIDDPRLMRKFEFETRVREFQFLVSEIYKSADRFAQIETIKLENEKLKAVEAISKAVAHDIRSPLAALNMVLKKETPLENVEYRIMETAIRRIQGIADDLTATEKESSEAAKPLLLNVALQNLVSEKRQEYDGIKGVNIKLLPQKTLTFATIPGIELNRILSNLINNAVESINQKSGIIQISVADYGKECRLKIQDTGCGISPETLNKLNSGISVTEGKEHHDSSGSGIGASSAYEKIKSIGGNIFFQSVVGEGTTVCMDIPMVEKPAHYIDQIKIFPRKLTLSIDDDMSVLEIWKSKFRNIEGELKCFSNLKDVSRWIEKNKIERVGLIFCDFRFGSSESNGLEFLIQHKAMFEGILVTSEFEDHEVIQKCKKHNIKILPKFHLPCTDLVPVAH